MAAGPCGYEFRQAFSCFHYSEADPKGSDCIDQFRAMQACMASHPGLYDSEKDDDDDMPVLDVGEPESAEAKPDDVGTEVKQDIVSKVNEQTETETKN